jgi:hypothetical protein
VRTNHYATAKAITSREQEAPPIEITLLMLSKAADIGSRPLATEAVGTVEMTSVIIRVAKLTGSMTTEMGASLTDAVDTTRITDE